MQWPHYQCTARGRRTLEFCPWSGVGKANAYPSADMGRHQVAAREHEAPPRNRKCTHEHEEAVREISTPCTRCIDGASARSRKRTCTRCSPLIALPTFPCMLGSLPIARSVQYKTKRLIPTEFIEKLRKKWTWLTGSAPVQRNAMATVGCNERDQFRGAGAWIKF
jgi:hypothetical protein